MKRVIALIALLPFWLAACTQEPDTEQRAAAAEQANALFENYFEEVIELNPLYATFIGDDRYNDRFANSIGPEHRAAELALDKRYLAKINAIDPALLDGQARLSYEIFKRDLERDIAAERFPSHLLPINQFYSTPNFFVQLGSGSSAHPFKTVKDYEDFLKRIDGFLAWMDQAQVNMREGIEKGVVQPRILMERTLPQLESQLVDDITQSLFYKPVTNMPEDFSAEDRARLTAAYEAAIRDKLIPAYRELHDFIKNDYLPHTRDVVGMHALPDGEAWYAFLVENTTTTDLTLEQIHQIGLDEVARIHAEIRGVMEQVGFDGTMHEFFKYTESDPQFFYDSGEELVQGYRDLKHVVDPLLPKLFELFPKAEYEVRAVEPFREKSASGASYMRGTPDGSRPGVFYVNTYDIKARPKWAMESLSLHEAAPGHHFQLSIQQEMEGLPRFRRFGGYTAYTEGWGLYAESLGKELGVYTDPYQYYGALQAELWRAIRLVVDTGLHYKGWSREDVLNYMYENSAVAEARAVSEAERYIAIPSQALAYKIGQLKIAELRARAADKLGEKFNVKAFHTQILKDGALPLEVLDAKIERWIAAQQ